MAADAYDLQGRTVLITGAARGIGAEAARQLAARGARLSLAGLEPERLEALAGELGPDAAWFEVDVRDPDALERAVAGTVERFGGIDVVIANAGIRPPVATVSSVEPAAFERVIEINLLGVWRTVRSALPHVIERQGYVLCVASLAAAAHAPLMAPYNAAKAGVEAFGNSLRGELGHHGVDVGVAYFGFIDTDMVREGQAEGERRLPGRGASVFGRPLPVSRAGEAIVRGVERRARRVVAPRYIYPALIAPGVIPRVLDALVRHSRAGELVRAAERDPER
jgi:NAD(P)-dependent dehydrogenase (short-subunit alcohol dehydrogenase family)